MASFFCGAGARFNRRHHGLRREARAVFSNHYQFFGYSPANADTAEKFRRCWGFCTSKPPSVLTDSTTRPTGDIFGLRLPPLSKTARNFPAGFPEASQ
jgi:hypothetical protein